MTRRELLGLVASALALPGAADFFGTWLTAAQQPQHHGGWQPPEPPLLRDYQPKFFDAADFGVLRAFTEILIPTDETPGAREARCAHFIDFVLQASGEGSAKEWREAMRALRASGFYTADTAARLALVDAMSKPERERGATHPAYSAYRLIKQQTVFAFYTSRAGMIEALDYKGNSYNVTFPACEHEEHRRV
jgi:hypothetical protein